MKYVRKTVLWIIFALFIISLAVGGCVIFAVRNVNVTLISYSYQSENVEAEQKIASFKKDIFDSARGNLMLTLNEDKIAAAVNADSGFAVVSLKKVYPCTIDVTIKELKEVFSAKAEDGSYKIYDENGNYTEEVYKLYYE